MSSRSAPSDSAPIRRGSSSAPAAPREDPRHGRRPAEHQLAAWGIPHDTGTARAVALITAEPASDAITHGRLPGRGFRLAPRLLPYAVRRTPYAVRIEVRDTRPEFPLPDLPALTDAVAGRGLLIVDVFSDRWGCSVGDVRTDTVWAEVRLAGPWVPAGTHGPAGHPPGHRPTRGAPGE